MKTLSLLTAGLLLLPVGAAIADTGTASKTETTDAQGTTVTTEQSNVVKKGWTGATKEEAKVTTEVDPKGLGNSVKTEVERERVVKDAGNFKDSLKVEHANGTVEEETVKKKTAGHLLNDGTTTTTTRSKMVDPKGLGNKRTSEVKEKTETNPDGSFKKSVTKKVNGDTVSETEVTR